MIPKHITNRKGARSLKDLDTEVLSYLNTGKIQTKNLMEWLAADQLVLLQHILHELDRESWYDTFKEAVEIQKKPTANSNAKIIGITFSQLTQDHELYSQLAAHHSDIVRCWACWGISMQYDTLSDLLTEMRNFAADQHFGVREVVIFAIKNRMIAELDLAIDILSNWTKEIDHNLRRFAVESLRPVGVWTPKIAEFQETPEKGLPILEPVKSDASSYVRDAVGNWLNDASKSQAEWVKAVCSRWELESPTKETAYIIKRGLRTLNKQKNK